ncbi:Type III iodothyronine deiodinase [Chelonia mydas]|uniref:Iodothyronine deiodinase n=1 Tax=Chelonia mydas TaxID=8469 RepID=M7BLS1_CHEMY|nr:Type III iodothyronine deiodinase [Chelonia mydas]
MLHSLGVHTLQLLTQVAACILLFPRFLLTALMLWLLDFLCIRKKVLLMGSRAEEEACPGQEPPPDDPPVCVSDSNRMFTLESLKAVWHGQKLDFFKSAHRLAAHFVDIADFLLVYIEEAHPSDGWVSSDAAYQIPKHQCLQDRLRAAQLMQEGAPGCPLAVDTMDNASSAAYGAFFERLYIIQEEVVMYQGGRGPEGYKISELRSWLDQYKNRLQSPSTVVIHV